MVHKFEVQQRVKHQIRTITKFPSKETTRGLIHITSSRSPNIQLILELPIPRLEYECGDETVGSAKSRTPTI